MLIHELSKKNRSVRRFNQGIRLKESELLGYIDSARLAPCGANLQLLRFTPVTEQKDCARIFPALNWAAYLEDWNGPGEGERPAAYIIIHSPVLERFHLPVDVGIAVAYIVLDARESGYGSCMLMSFDRVIIEKEAGTPKGYHPYLTIAIGVPDEESLIEPVDEDIRYYRDSTDRLHVPKLSLDNIIIPVKE